MALFKRKNDDEKDLSIVDDYKEPFSFQNFWDEQVIGRVKTIHDFLKKNGILYFFMSPFQYKNRLFLKLGLIIAGVLIGVVPRMISLVDTAKERNAASEIANVQALSNSGSITLAPLASGQHDNTHLIVFNIGGDTKDGVPSTTSGFKVKLSPSRGVTNATKVKYQYEVLPVDQSNRLLLVYVDNRKQNDDTGIFNLDVHMKGQSAMKTPLEIVLSKNQKNTAVYKNGKINLSALSDKMTENSGTGKTAISDGKKALTEAVNVYKINEQRLNESGMTLGMTTAKLKEYVTQQTMLSSLTDNSTTKDIDGLNTTTPTMPSITSTINYKGQTFSDADSADSTDTQNAASASSTTNPARDTELPNLTTLIQNVMTDITNLNSARLAKYNALNTLERVLNQKVTPSDMSEPITVQNK